MKTTITVKTENGFVKIVTIKCTPTDYLLVSKALKMLAENEEVHEIDRRTAKDLFELGLKELKECESEEDTDQKSLEEWTAGEENRWESEE